jgi:hypothetical protein
LFSLGSTNNVLVHSRQGEREYVQINQLFLSERQYLKKRREYKSYSLQIGDLAAVLPAICFQTKRIAMIYWA